jgi:hypothetical protein
MPPAAVSHEAHVHCLYHHSQPAPALSVASPQPCLCIAAAICACCLSVPVRHCRRCSAGVQQTSAQDVCATSPMPHSARRPCTHAHMRCTQFGGAHRPLITCHCCPASSAHAALPRPRVLPMACTSTPHPTLPCTHPSTAAQRTRGTARTHTQSVDHHGTNRGQAGGVLRTTPPSCPRAARGAWQSTAGRP